MLLNKRKITQLASVISALILLSLCASGKTKHKLPKSKQSISIGIKAVEDVSFKPNQYPNTNKHIQTNLNKSLAIKKKITSRLSVETDFTEPLLKINTSGNNLNDTKNIFSLKPNQLTIPLTLQYYLLHTKTKLHPYCGAGIQYQYKNEVNQPLASESSPQSINDQKGTKSISIIFTQGMTFEVNTKIQINQSFHFIPGNSEKTLGFDVGIGYKFP